MNRYSRRQTLKRILLAAMIGVVAAGAGPVPAAAHHSATMFDETKTVTVEGVVKEWQLTNPHSWLLVDVRGKDGKVATWGFEAEGPSTLQRAGIRPSDLKPGTKLTITGHPMRDGQKAAIWGIGRHCRWQETRTSSGFRGEVTRYEARCTGNSHPADLGLCCGWLYWPLCFPAWLSPRQPKWI